MAYELFEMFEQFQVAKGGGEVRSLEGRGLHQGLPRDQVIQSVDILRSL